MNNGINYHSVIYNSNKRTQNQINFLITGKLIFKNLQNKVKYLEKKCCTQNNMEKYLQHTVKGKNEFKIQNIQFLFYSNICAEIIN